MKEQDEIKDLFKDSFDGFEVTPPASVKIHIDEKISQFQTKGKLKWYFVAGISVLILAFAVFLYNRDKSDVSTTHLATNGISEYDDKPSNGISEYGDKTKASETREIESKLNSGSKENQTIDNNSKALEKNKPALEKTSLKTSKQLVKTSKKQKTGNTKKIKNNSVNSNEKNTSKSNTNFASTKKKKSKKSRNKYPNKKINSEEITPVVYETPYKLKAEGNNDGRETIVTTIEKNDPAQNTYIDSNSIANADSLNSKENDSLEENYRMANVPKVNRPWLFSLKTGTSLGFNQLKSSSTLSLKEKSSFFIQTEFAYYLNSKMALSSGVNYQNNFENISQDQTVLGDSVILSYNYTYVLDSMQTVVDSIAIPVYGQDSTTINFANSYQVYSIGLPIIFQYSFEFNPKLFLDLSAGAILNLQGSRTNYEYLNTSSRTVNHFGVKACLRSQLRYQFSNWGVSLNTNFGYDFKPVQSWDNVTRKRSYLDLGVGIHYMIK